MFPSSKKCELSKALKIQALLAFMLSLASLVSWMYAFFKGYTLVSPELFKIYFAMDVFLLLPIYLFSSISVFFRRFDFEMIAMLSGFIIFCTRVVILLGGLLSPVIDGQASWFVIFLLLPLQAWLFSLYLGQHLHLVQVSKSFSQTCES